MISSIGAYASDIVQFMQISQNASEKTQATQGLSFDELIENGEITATKQEEHSTGITTMGNVSSGSSNNSSETYSEMDLNQDGQVTIDEIMRYNEMQMMEKMQEQMAEENNNESNPDDNEKKSSNDKHLLDAFKNQMATKAYQMGESLISTSIGAITQSFAV